MSFVAIVLFLIFLFLNASGTIDWPAYLIAAPLWGYLVFAVCILMEKAVITGFNSEEKKK